jgi:mono/diheme cytochrome c family protein
VSLSVVIGVQLAILGAVLFAFRPQIMRRWPEAEGALAIPRSAALVIGMLLVIFGLAGGATPLSGTPNPVPNTVTSAAAGREVFLANCASCHGSGAQGDGPMAGTTQVKPPSLTAHLSVHSDGDLFYWITNGLPGGMPAFTDLSEADRWNVINYLRVLNGVRPTPDATAAASGLIPMGLPLAGGLLGCWFGALAWRSRRRRPHHPQ